MAGGYSVWRSEDWGKLIGDTPSATAILDRFLHHAEIVSITGKSYRLRNRAGGQQPEGQAAEAKPAISPAGSKGSKRPPAAEEASKK